MSEKKSHRVEAKIVTTLELPDGYIIDVDYIGGERIFYNPATRRRFKVKALPPVIQYEVEEIHPR